MPAIQFRISGLVQGVFFRAQTKERADQLGVKGWVRNEPDGSVLVHAEGTEDQLRQLEAWCQHGPPAARVDHIEKMETHESGASTFDITR